MNNVGITILVILMVPVLFQVISLSLKQTGRHQEIQEILRRIEERLEKTNE